MTERGRTKLTRSDNHLTIGPSALHWDGNSLTIWIEEVTAPLPSRLSGVVKVTPRALTGRSVHARCLEPGRGWAPSLVADRAGGRCRGDDDAAGPVVVRNRLPRQQRGRPAAGARFSRLGLVPRADERGRDHSLQCAAPGRGAAGFGVAHRRRRWRSNNSRRRRRHACPARFGVCTQARAATRIRIPIVRQRLEDAPFYARSVIETRLGGERVHAVHECLVMDRFTAPWVQAMLPFRIPRAR